MASNKELLRYGTGTVLTVILILASFNLESTPPVWWDEGWILSIARNWIELGHYGRLLAGEPISGSMTNGFPVIAPIAMSFRFLGIGIWEGRIAVLVFGVGALILIFYLAFRLYGRSVAIGTLLVLMFMSGHQELHPILMARQALGEIPTLFYLLVGYAFFLMAQNAPFWAIPLAILFWSIALITKLQVLPFWAASLLVPLAVVLFRRKWNQTGSLALALVASVITSRALLGLLQLFLHNSTLPMPQTSGLYDVTAVVWAPRARLFALVVILLFGMPTLLGLCYAARNFVKTKDRVLIQDYTEIVRLALVVLAGSWFLWYATLSVGWLRYLFPATFIGSIFVAAMLYDLTGRFSVYNTIKQAGSVPRHLSFNRQSIGGLLAVTLIAVSLPTTLRMLYELYLVKADISVLEVAEFLNTQTAPNALIETYDSELFFLLERRYHYPPDEIHVELNRRTFLGQPVPIEYDPLAQNPDYLVVGPHSSLWGLYEPVLKKGAFRLLRAYSRYEVYERVR